MPALSVSRRTSDTKEEADQSIVLFEEIKFIFSREKSPAMLEKQIRKENNRFLTISTLFFR
jgi:hypothetical protein